MESVEVAEVIFLDEYNRPKGKLKVFAPKKDTLFLLNQTEARSFGEEPVQLVEGCIYEYQLLDIASGIKFKENEAIIPSKNSANSGRIETGLYNGLLIFNLDDINGNPVAWLSLEVRSTKLNYRDEYREMLNFVGEKCNDLLLDIKSPFQLKFLHEVGGSPETILQKFAFLKSILDTREFKDALQRIVTLSHRGVINEKVEVSIRRRFKPESNTLKQIAQNSKRRQINEVHPLYSLMKERGVSYPSVPESLFITSKREIEDTPENRFVKYSLKVYVDFLSKIENVLIKRKAAPFKRMLIEVKSIRERLEETLSLDFFTRISEPTFLPIGSPVLQNKAGYREVLRTWLKFNLGANLIWEARDEFFGSGKRNLPLLYEYWLFFHLLDLIASKFKLEKLPVYSLIEMHEDGMYLKLKSGKQLVINGTYKKNDVAFKIQFTYNRTFSATNNRNLVGSWTRQMRPDYTLSIWPNNLNVGEAEESGAIVHLHFDAKYRVDSIEGIFGKEDENLEEERNKQRQEVYKRADLLKMHAYKDAIKRTQGAYILYPGNQNRIWREFEEVLPSVGAFAVRPGNSGEAIGLHDLSGFLTEVLDFLELKFTGSTN